VSLALGFVTLILGRKILVTVEEQVIAAGIVV
jgi:hypothetical protein